MAGYEAGRTIAQLQASGFLDAHRGTPFYAQRQEHIAEVYRTLRAVRVVLYTTPALNTLTANNEYCASYTECGRDLLVPAVTIGLSGSFRRFVAVAEVSLERQAMASRTSPLYDDAWAHRETTGSFFVGRSGPPARAWSYSVLGGLSFIRTDSDGISREKQAFAGTGGRQPVHARAMHFGITGGADLLFPVGSRLGVVFSLRVTYAFGEQTELRPGALSVRAGAGLRFGVYRTAE